jgi:hypothetical protein
MHCEFESILDSILMCTTCRADESSCSVSCPPQVSKAGGGSKKFFRSRNCTPHFQNRGAALVNTNRFPGNVVPLCQASSSVDTNFAR